MKQITKMFGSGGLSLVLVIMLTVLIAGCGQKADAPATSGDTQTQQEKKETQDATVSSADDDDKTQDPKGGDSKEYTLEDIDGWWKVTHATRSDDIWDFEGDTLDEYNWNYEVPGVFGIDSKDQTYILHTVGIYMYGNITPSEDKPNEFVLECSTGDGAALYLKDGKATCTVNKDSIVINADVQYSSDGKEDHAFSMQMSCVPDEDNRGTETGSLMDTLAALDDDVHNKRLEYYEPMDHNDREIIVATDGSKEISQDVYWENPVTMTLLSVNETDDSIILVMDCGANVPNERLMVNRYVAQPLILNGNIEIENNIGCVIPPNDPSAKDDPDAIWWARYCSLTIPKSVVGSVSEIQSIAGKIEITTFDWFPFESLDFEVTAADLQ